jgi:pimeloyl-ACP methyl ester carboxylesterase
MHMELLPARARDLLTATCRPTPELMRGYWGEVFEGGSTLARRMDAELVRLRAAAVPYLAIAGDEPGQDYRRWLSGVLPRAELEVWPGSGHFPHLADPARFAGVLLATENWPAADVHS